MRPNSMPDRLDQLDYYTLLRIEEASSADAIREAFHVFALRYHPDRFAGAPEEKRERAAQIYRRGAEGYRVLMNQGSRSRYDEGLAEGRLRLTAEEERREEMARRNPTTGQLGVRSLRARPFATKAQMAFNRGAAPLYRSSSALRESRGSANSKSTNAFSNLPSIT